MDSNYTYGTNMNTLNIQQPTTKKALSITSLILGILSLFCCCCGGLTSIAGLILGIIALKKEPAGKKLAIAGIITSSIAILITIIGLLTGSFGMLIDRTKDIISGDYESSDYDEYESSTGVDFPKGYDYQEYTLFNGSSFIGSDESTFYFNPNDDTCVWLEEQFNEDNKIYYSYRVLLGRDAKDWLLEHKGDKVTTGHMFYLDDDFAAVILIPIEVHKNGVTEPFEPELTSWFGYFDGETFDAQNSDTGDYVTYHLEYRVN